MPISRAVCAEAMNRRIRNVSNSTSTTLMPMSPTITTPLSSTRSSRSAKESARSAKEDHQLSGIGRAAQVAPEPFTRAELALTVQVDPVGGHHRGGIRNPRQLDHVDQHRPAALGTRAYSGDGLWCRSGQRAELTHRRGRGEGESGGGPVFRGFFITVHGWWRFIHRIPCGNGGRPP